ncbi:MAG: C69 family dipeptidase [Gemmataceae bacterium]|nr:C69 family dipeptidase [Gemmataceae bacterium]
MASDVMVAFGPATAANETHFGFQVYGHAGGQEWVLKSWPRNNHPPDEVLMLSRVELPQVKQTAGLIAVQCRGDWGVVHGCNDQGVAVGVGQWRCVRPKMEAGGLLGSELGRLILERSHSARHAIEVVTDLIARYGHGASEAGCASAILIADHHEAYLLEVVGKYWALLECQSARAVADVGLIRQDWQRLSPGLAERAIEQGWWPDDGSKLDFHGCLGGRDAADAWALRRWGQATLGLAQRSGTFTTATFRDFLLSHFQRNVCRHPAAPPKLARLVSCVATIRAAAAPVFWVEVGVAAGPLWFPLVVGGQLSEAWTGRVLGQRLDEAPPVAEEELTQLQREFDQDAEDFVAEACALSGCGEAAAMVRLGEAMMQKHWERWLTACERGLIADAAQRPVVEEETLATFAFG